MRSYHIVVLTHISLIISDSEHLFKHLLVIYISSWGKHLLKYFANFLDCVVWFGDIELYQLFVYFGN